MLQDYWIGYIACIAAIMLAQLSAKAADRFGVLQSPDNNARNVAMDGARGYLALVVYFHHFTFAFNRVSSGQWNPPPDRPFTNAGPLAVMAFFMITGFLFYGRMSKMKHVSDWTRMYIGRLFRIAPMYLVSVTAVLLVSFAFGGFVFRTGFWKLEGDTASWMALGWLGTPAWNADSEVFLVNAGVTWTLRYEWLFYFMLPVVAGFIHLVRWRLLRMSVITALAIKFAVMPQQIAFDFNSIFAAPFLAGFLAREIMEFARIRRFASSRIAALIGIAAIYNSLFMRGYFTHEQVVAMFIFFVPVAAGNGYFGMLTNHAARVLGETSFSIYLIHGIVLYIVVQVLAALSILPQGIAAWLLLPALVVPVVLLSALGYRLVEVPGINAGKSIANSLAGHPPTRASGDIAAYAPVRTATVDVARRPLD